MFIISASFSQPLDTDKIVKEMKNNFPGVSQIPGEFTSRYVDRMKEITEKVEATARQVRKFKNQQLRGFWESCFNHILIRSAKNQYF